jgi:DNA mismatch endonuclease (patch repair protein)
MGCTKQEWWTEKLLGNRKRDQKHQKELEEMGWRVLVVWECEVRNNNS